MGVLTWNDLGMTQRVPAFDGRRALRVRVGNQGDGAPTDIAQAKVRGMADAASFERAADSARGERATGSEVRGTQDAALGVRAA